MPRVRRRARVDRDVRPGHVVLVGGRGGGVSRGAVGPAWGGARGRTVRSGRGAFFRGVLGGGALPPAFAGRVPSVPAVVARGEGPAARMAGLPVDPGPAALGVDEPMEAV